jgi:hypothetical protein
MSNNRHTFCTIITGNYLPYALALLGSLRKFSSNVHFNILFSDVSDAETLDSVSPDDNTFYHFTGTLCYDGTGKLIYDKYLATDHDSFRWSMKPVFLNYLVKEKGYEKVIYTDSDILFFNDFSFLLDKLDKADVLLSPHWRSGDPMADKDNFRLLFTDGMFNGGFVGITPGGINAMNWWANACAWYCAKDTGNGFFVDQKYLDALPAFFDNIGVINHRGCNVANWNQEECKRILDVNQEVLINGSFPVIFIHFTASTIKGILKGEDHRLLPYLELYASTLKSFNPNIDIIAKYRQLLNSSPVNVVHKRSLLNRALKKLKNFLL